MDDLDTYRFSDFILFSQTVYYRQFELYNNAIWPLHIFAMLLACAIVYALWKKPVWAGRLVSIILVASWLWVAWAFLYSRFYNIHIVANWYAFGFILQAGLLAWYGVIRNELTEFVESTWRINLGRGLLFLSLVLYPFIPVLTGRNWIQFEMFSLAPDPTVLATMAFLLLCRSPSIIYLIPISWVFVSGMTLFNM